MKKRYPIIILSLSIALVGIYFFSQKKINTTPLQTTNDHIHDHHHNHKDHPHKISEVKRKPASIKVPVKEIEVKKLTKREKKLKKLVALRDKMLKEHEVKLTKTIKQNNKQLKLTKLKVLERIFYKNQTSVVISTNVKGTLYSFNAIVDDKSGEVIKTWSKTFHEPWANHKHEHQ